MKPSPSSKRKRKPTRGEIGARLRIYNPPRHLERVLTARLTFNNPLYATLLRHSPWGARNCPETICLAERMPKYLEIPRGFDFSKLGGKSRKQWDRIIWEDLRNSVPVSFPKPLLTLNAEQKKAFAAFKKLVLGKQERPFGSSLLVLPTSGGKTILSASLAALCGEKVLVLCKTNLIKKAWQDDLQKLYGMDPKKDLGIIQQNKIKLGKHVTLASTATLARRKHLYAEIFGQIGMLIIDEAHCIGADTIADIVANCPAKYIIGVTATPTRRDGKSYLVQSNLGAPIVRVLNKQKETASSFPLSDARFVRTMFQFKDEESGEAFDPELNPYVHLIAQLSADKERNRQIVAEVKADWKAGHSVLVATSLLSHVSELKKMLTEAGVKNVSVISGNVNSKRKLSEKTIDDIMSRKSRCVIATVSAIKLGANLNPLDRLHCVVPVNESDMEQLIGRIRRKHPSKKDAKFTYYADDDAFLFNKFKRTFYKVMRKLQVKRYTNLYVT